MKEAGPPKRVVSKSVILGPGRNKGDKYGQKRDKQILWSRMARGLYGSGQTRDMDSSIKTQRKDAREKAGPMLTRQNAAPCLSWGE